MSTTIKLKRNSTPSAAPSDLEYGELALNYADGKLYYKNSSDEIASFTAGTSIGNELSLLRADGSDDTIPVQIDNTTLTNLADNTYILFTLANGSDVTTLRLTS